MVIIYEIIYFLLCHSTLVANVDTLRTPDDLFNDSVKKTFPEQLLLQSNPTDATIQITRLQNWFSQVSVRVSNTTAVVRKITVPGINNYIGLYFIIIGRSLDSSGGINFLHQNIRLINRALSKVGVLSFIAGVATNPSLPPDLSNVSLEIFAAGVASKLEDILKSRIFGAILAVFVFKQKSPQLISSTSEVCNGPNSVYWHYDWSSEINSQLNSSDELFRDIIVHLGACSASCGDLALCETIFDVNARFLGKIMLQCIATNIQNNQEAWCSLKPPEDVHIPVCGNGIIENNENCDCLNPSECSCDCDSKCNIRKRILSGTNRYFIISVSAAIIFLIVGASGLFLFLYFRQRNSVGSRTSSTSIRHGESKTEFHVPLQGKVKDWTLTCTVGEVTRLNSKSKLDLRTKKISSKENSKSLTTAMSKERLKSLKISSKDIFKSKSIAMIKEKLKPRKISSKDHSKSKKNSMSKGKLEPKNISRTNITQSNSLVDSTKSIEQRKSSKSIAKSIGKMTLTISPKTVSSKSLQQSKAQKNNLKHNS